MSLNEEQKIKDPSVEGTNGLKGINRGRSQETPAFNISDYKNYINYIHNNVSPREYVGFTGLNDSSYDKEITTIDQLVNLNNTRGELQPWYSQIANGLAKGAITASTTFLNGTIGLLYGGMSAIGNRQFSNIWNNPIMSGLQSINEKSEKWFPNYYTDEELKASENFLDNPLDAIFTANFLGDKLLKNLGFTIGAFYSGGVASKALSSAGKMIEATKLGSSLIKGASNVAEHIKLVKNAGDFPSLVNASVGAITSAASEGAIEGYNAAKEWYDNYKNQLDTEYAKSLAAIDGLKGLEEYDILKEDIDKDYTETLQRLNEDRIKIGNIVLKANVPLLAASNLYQFGKLYSGGFKTAMRTKNIANKSNIKNLKQALKNGVKEGNISEVLSEYAKLTSNKTIPKAILSSLKVSATEGFEEINQSAITKIAQLGYEQDINNFYKAKADPEAEEQTIDWMKAISQGFNETYSDPQSWEEFTLGSLTGAMGMPSFRSFKDSKGKFQSPITLRGGIAGEYKDYMKEKQEENKVASYINDRLTSPEFLNFYKGINRHNFYQDIMDASVDANDAFSFKNAEHSQFISDIIMFDNAGKLGDLKTILNAAYDTSDRNLEQIKQDFNIQTPSNSLEDIKKNITKTKEDIDKTIDRYVEIKDFYDINTGGKLNDEQLETVIWAQSQIDNWKERAGQIVDDITPILFSLKNSLKLKQQELNTNKEDTKENNKINTIIDNISLVSDILDILKQNNFNDSINKTVLNNKIKSNILDIIQSTPSLLGAEDTNILQTKIQDLNKIFNGISTYNKKIKEYIDNPQAQQKDVEKADTETVKKTNTHKKNTLAKRFDWNKDIKDIADTYIQNKEEIDNFGGIEELKKNLTSEESNKLDKALKYIKIYNALQNKINVSNLNSKEKSLLQKSINKYLDSNADPTEIIPSLIEEFTTYVPDEEDITAPEDVDDLSESSLKVLEFLNDEASSIEDDIAAQADIFTKTEESLKNIDKASEAATKSEEELYIPQDIDTTDNIPQDIPEEIPQEVSIITDQELEQQEVEYKTNETDFKDVKKQKSASVDKQSSNNKEYIFRPNISEYMFNTKDYTTYYDFLENNQSYIPDGVDKQAFLNYIKTIHEYLQSKGAFTYVKGTDENNRLKIDDEIYFIIDKNLNDKLDSSIGKIVLLGVKKGDSYQVVGSLPSKIEFEIYQKYKSNGKLINEKKTKAEKFPELKALYDSVIKGYEESNIKDIYIFDKVSKVKSLLGGTIMFNSNKETSVASIVTNEVPVLAVSTNNGLTNGNKKMSDSFVFPLQDKIGRVYLMVPSNKGTRLPALCYSEHIKNLSNNDWYMQNILKTLNDIISSPIYIKNNIIELFKWITLPKLQITFGNIINGQYVQNRDLSNNYTAIKITYNKPTDSNPNNRATLALLRVSQENSVPIISKEEAVNLFNALRTIPSLTTNVNKDKLTDSVEHIEYRKNISRYLFTNMNEDSNHTINDWFVFENPKIPYKTTELKERATKGDELKVLSSEKPITGNTQGIEIIDSTELDLGFEERKEIPIPKPNENSFIEKLGNAFGQPANFGLKDVGLKENNSLDTPKPRRRMVKRTMIMTDEIPDTIENRNRTINKIKALIPGLSDDNIKVIADSFIRISDNSNNPIKCFGLFKNGIITLSSKSPIGTAYHEAFHYVFNTLLDNNTVFNVLKEASEIYNSDKVLFLEEKLAEKFRFFMLGMEDTSLKGRIKSSFTKVRFLVKTLFNSMSYIDSLFYNIYKGNISNNIKNKMLDIDYSTNINEYYNTKYKYDNLSEENKELLSLRNISKQDFDELSVKNKEYLLHCMF